MKRTIAILAFLVFISGVALGQAGRAGYGGQEKNLRGLKGVWLTVGFGRADGVAEEDRSAVLKLVEADARAKLQKVGLTLFQKVDEIQNAGSPWLEIQITCVKPNAFVYPVKTKVTLLQHVRLARDPSIEADLATWEQWGICGPTVPVEMIRSQVAMEIDQFIKDYLTVNSTATRR